MSQREREVTTRTSFDQALRARLLRNLRSFERRPSADGELCRAAVAVAVVPDEDGAASFVLTRRSAGLSRHGGQFALPGGRLDRGETPEQAALRELAEEVGLVASPDSVMGLLDDYPTRSGFAITPVVLWAGNPGALIPNPAEVAAVYRVPLDELRRPGAPRLSRIPESERPLISFPILGTYVHAPTAAILFQLVEVSFFGRATRVAHFEQPVFAWR